MPQRLMSPLTLDPPPQEWRWSLRMGGRRPECFSYRERSLTKSIQTSDSPPWVDIRIYIINICIYISSFKIYVIHVRDIKFSEGIYTYREKEKGRQRQRQKKKPNHTWQIFKVCQFRWRLDGHGWYSYFPTTWELLEKSWTKIPMSESYTNPVKSESRGSSVFLKISPGDADKQSRLRSTDAGLPISPASFFNLVSHACCTEVSLPPSRCNSELTPASWPLYLLCSLPGMLFFPPSQSGLLVTQDLAYIGSPALSLSSTPDRSSSSFKFSKAFFSYHSYPLSSWHYPVWICEPENTCTAFLVFPAASQIVSSQMEGTRHI